MIAVIDYGLGNVSAFLTVYKKLGVPARPAARPEDIEGASGLILPGVGAFDFAMRRLEDSGLRPALEEAVRSGVPVLGVCVGMQMMAVRSEEGSLTGLGWLDAEVRAFGASRGVPVPHMGWNEVKSISSCPLFEGLSPDERFYFLHSYYFIAKDRSLAAAVTDYGGEFDCAAASGRVFGVQFHPEKSHAAGMRLLENFSKVS
ncbi:MAG TPA: imidazole glycerol phosphate synthase subunit HisH [Elusimicrobiales bacterium]|nr:imidazole glycerol phosphate synthase subunit HisH [Elusimicrobiales bacterium]